MIDKTCLSFWFPALLAAGLPVPRTEIVRLSEEDQDDLMAVVMAGEGYGPPKGDGFDRLVSQLRTHADRIGYPCFLRSGHFSGKHSWADTCYVTGPEQIADHVKAIQYMGECFSMMGMPCGVWVIREFLKPKPYDVAFHADRFGGMPVRREFRVFVRDGVVECLHPYWPPDAFEDRVPLTEGQAAALAAMNEPGIHEAEIRGLAARVGAVLPGYWSVDVLSTDRGWYVTDMAEGGQSWHWPECEKDAR